MLSLISLFINTISQVGGNNMIMGGQFDNHNCMIGAGYSWCDSSQNCIRIWETPCQDYYNDCGDCLKRQSHGQNIACPVDCNLPVMGPTPVPFILTSCPEVMCDLYCENGNIKDNNGCDTCSCNDNPLIVIDPEPPMPPVLQSNVCSILQEASIHKCESNCHNCDLDNTRILLNNCLDQNGNNAYDSICSENIENYECPIEYNDCELEYVCPKITEVTQCSDGGIEGYTTYQLSLIINNDNVKDIYAIYGSDENDACPMDIPAAYQGNTVFNNNIGGVNPELISINSDSEFDSWLTIGLTDGDPSNKLSTIGIDFNSWTDINGIYTTNGAVFVMDPEENIIQGNEYIVAQLTIPNDISYDISLNAQGKKKYSNSNIPLDQSWHQEGIIFNVSPPNRVIHNTIPNNCVMWYDGCNRCQVNNGIMGSCTRMMCFTLDNPRCLSFNRNGH